MCPLIRPSLSSRATRLALVGLLCQAFAASAQMVPRAEHFISESQTSNVTALRVRWAGDAALEDGRRQGLALKGQARWPRWEGRIGAVIDRPVNPVRDKFVLAQPAKAGLNMRSMHVLSDYYVDGGFRATLGLVSGEAGQAWWSSGDHGGGLNISLQHIDSLGAPVGLGDQRGLTLPQPNAYVGAGYSSLLGGSGRSEAWRINADFGLIDTNVGGNNRFSGVLQGDRSLDDTLRSMRMRPVLKVSVGYAF